MKKLGVLVLCAGLAALCAACGSAPSQLGEWQIVKQLENAPMGDYGDGDLDRILGASLVFSADKASCFGDSVSTLGDTVDKPDYVVGEVPRSSIEGGMGTTVQALGGSGGDTLTQIAVIRDPERNTGIVMYLISNDTLVINGAGTFFLARRVK